jgi:hypothetical protein
MSGRLKVALVPVQAQKPPYEPTQAEKDAVAAHESRRKKRRPAPDLGVTFEGNKALIDPDHPDPQTGIRLIMEAIGTPEPSFYHSFLDQLVNLTSKDGKPDEDMLNFALAVVKGIEPNDQVEAMLAAQMVAVHMATLTLAKRLEHVQTLPQQDSAAGAFNKLARTFATQVEALKRYRSTGEQKVTVQHVNVNDGGQAIVGNVTTGGSEKNDR